jgi:hypothetical protein
MEPAGSPRAAKSVPGAAMHREKQRRTIARFMKKEFLSEVLQQTLL